MKKYTALAVSSALALTLLSAPSAGASFGSSSPVLREPAEGEMKFEPAEQPALGSAYTGSAPLSLLLAALSIGVVAKLLTDNIPVLRQGLDDIAASVGLAGAPGSSEATRSFPATDFNLEPLITGLLAGPGGVA
ncbi:hypothetical protein [Corynebacterium qintianiae]|uniref:hypothetical protein n=1 Tax=Corynebacterium qintianiae TaxID=2709392 RepID=UPI0013ECF9EB|nr:hypothetical protein [Corynebacterium qintianiae]